jgi:hypothetical protein
MKMRATKIYPKMKNPERLANHLASCSCHMCGNPRRHFAELTMQERKAVEAAKSQVQEIE